MATFTDKVTGGEWRNSEPRPQGSDYPSPLPCGRGSESNPPAHDTARALAAAVSTSLLLYLAYFPVGCAWLAWFALVPWLTLVRSRLARWRLYLLSYAAGLCFYGPVLQWMRVADPRMYATWIMLAVYIACYFPLALWLLRWLERRTALPLVITLPVVWTALEMLRAHCMTGFPWYFLAHTQHDYLTLIQVSDLTGAYGVSFLVAAVNGLLFEALWRYRASGGREPPVGNVSTGGSRPPLALTRLLVWTGAVFVVVLGVLGYGACRLNQDRQQPGPRVALVQGNVPQGVRNDASGPDGEEQNRASRDLGFHFIDLSDLAAKFAPDLIVWPETSYPGEWKQIARDHPRTDISKEWRERETKWEDETQAVAERWQAAVLLGANACELQADNSLRRCNSALLVTPEGRVEGRYDKIHRVPFGEYVPLRGWIPGMSYFAPYDYDYEVVAGEGHPALPVTGRSGRTWTFGVNICFEDTDPTIAPPYVSGPEPVDFLVNISNDGWFKGTIEHEQHLALCRFRAVECRRSVVRAVNMGISVVIDGNGRVLRPRPKPGPAALGMLVGLPWKTLRPTLTDVQVWSIPADRSEWSELPLREWSQYKAVPGVLLATVPIDSRGSLYARWGDWLPWSCWGLLGLVFLGRFRSRSARPETLGYHTTATPA